jgi:hypothetical protein
MQNQIIKEALLHARPNKRSARRDLNVMAESEKVT